MNIETLLAILTEIGVPNEVVAEADSSWQLRQDLGLSSAETVALQARLREEFAVSISLWGRQDYSLDEILCLIK